MRQNIPCSIDYFSIFKSCYNATCFKYALRVLKYLYLTKDLKIYKRYTKTDVIYCMVDGGWARDCNDKQQIVWKCYFFEIA